MSFHFASRSALALSNTSELEIKNLLKQVDTMIHHKKLRWERQKHELDNKLVLKEQEYSNQKAELEQKNNEVLLHCEMIKFVFMFQLSHLIIVDQAAEGSARKHGVNHSGDNEKI